MPPFADSSNRGSPCTSSTHFATQIRSDVLLEDDRSLLSTTLAEGLGKMVTHFSAAPRTKLLHVDHTAHASTTMH